MVKEGYKETEIGVIPEDWDVCRLGDVASFKNGVAHENSISKNGRYIVVNSKFVSTEGIVKKYSDLCLQPCFENDILMVMSDVPNGRAIAKCFYVSQNDLYTLNQRICALTTKTSEAKYLFYAINRHPYFLSFDDGVKQTNLTKNNILECKLCIPENNEQKRIAKSLSDMDNLISSLEKLIEKKKAIKQGAMQELLTGKKRLPGFSGKIEYKPIRVLCEVFTDGDWIESKDQSSDGIRLIQTGNIGVGKYLDKDDKQRFISEDTFKKLNCFEVFENDVLVSRLPEPAGRACILPVSSKRRITAVDCTIIRFAKYNPILFVAYSQTKEYQNNVDIAMAGSTRQRISRKDLGEIPIPVFPTKEEQDAIASILSDMDAEITVLEQKMAKCKKLQQGMMQQLLTGRIRLI